MKRIRVAAALKYALETIQETPGAIEMELLRVPAYARHYLKTANPRSNIWSGTYATRGQTHTGAAELAQIATAALKTFTSNR